VATCGIVDLEVLYSAVDHSNLVEIRRERRIALTRIDTEQRDFDRAIDVMEELARRSLHRSVGAADLLQAAVAERAGLTVIHYDSDFEIVASVTGQPTKWVVPRGTLP
jgi:predicted nucleic acid-binding protein